MKASRISLIALFSFVCVSLSAQVFVGGNFSLNASGGSTSSGTSTTKNPSSFSFNLSPKAGIFLSEKFAVGSALDISFTGTKTPGNTEISSTSSTIGIVPFLRYYAIKMNKFSVFGQGNIGLSLSNSSSKIGATSMDGPKTTRLFLSIYPGLSYDISDKLSLETSLNILSFGYSYNITTHNSEKDKTSSFNIGAGLGNIVSVGAISIGAIYKF
jgi:hypothetical protein